MKNKETLKAAMDRRLSFLDDTPSCRPALMQRIVQEEEPVMKKKWSVGLVCALLILSLSVMAVAAGLILSPRVSATRMADQALEKTYGITDQLQTFFGREEKELPDGAREPAPWRLRWEPILRWSGTARRKSPGAMTERIPPAAMKPKPGAWNS